MKMKSIWLSWLYMYILCAVLGFIPAPTGFMKVVLILVALAFFVPAFLLLFKAEAREDRKTLKLIRNLSLISLGATTVAIMLNFASALLSKAWGVVLNGILVVVSSPMVCSQYWFIGLFGWACVLMTALTMLKKK